LYDIFLCSHYISNCLINQNPTRRQTYDNLISAAKSAGAGEVNAVSGVELNLDEFTSVRFGQDQRLEEVSRMLCSSTIPSVRLLERPELKYASCGILYLNDLI